MTDQVFTSDGIDGAGQTPPSTMKSAQARRHVERAYAHANAGRLEGALQECDRAIELTPGWAEAHNLRGVVLDEMGRAGEAIAAYEEAVELDASFEEAAKNLAEAREEAREDGPRWKRIAAFAIPLAVLVAVLIVFAALETRRGPDWQHELDNYLAESASPSETVTIQSVTDARAPHDFRPDMGAAVRDDWRWSGITPPFPAQAVKCVLLERSTGTAGSDEERSTHQVVFVAYHTDALYRVGWLAYAGPQEPFPEELMEHMATIGCDLDLE